ncbi:MAG: hypothetical protein LBL26_08660 [Peptococcaceae bacterium]|nr:hypothetical protein [Peptococcaceae bacterium]
MNTLVTENEVMTDKQWDGMLMMIAEIVEKCKDKEEILAAIKNFLKSLGVGVVLCGERRIMRDYSGGRWGGVISCHSGLVPESKK